MAAETVYELVGYAGSILVIVSLAMSSIIRLRVINLIGAATFSVYGVLIGSVPIIITNVIISGIDIYYLRKELTTREVITIIVVKPGDPFVKEFLSFYADDIKRFRPSFDVERPIDVVFLMLRDITPAGVFLASAPSDDELTIELDYVAPPFRDLRSGAILYQDDGRRFRDLGWFKLVIDDVDDRQSDYFIDMEFRSEGERRMVRQFLPS